jgi:uncharacterized protein (DUF1778 family)
MLRWKVEDLTMPATERIDFRTTSRVKTAIQKAADRLGLTVSAFIAQNAYEAAQRVLTLENLVLADRDRDIFLAALERPPKANAALKALLRKKR